MGFIFAAVQRPVAMPSRAVERRKNSRFDMHFPVFLRPVGEPWICTETADISAAGIGFSTERPIALHTPVEYILTFPQELTKAAHYLRMRCYASVVRCERLPGENGTFGIAVRNTAHRYLTREEAAQFDPLDVRKQGYTPNPFLVPERKTGT